MMEGTCFSMELEESNIAQTYVSSDFAQLL